MISVIAITPGVFERDFNPDIAQLSKTLRQLGEWLISRTRPPTTLVADLYNGGWLAELGKIRHSYEKCDKDSDLWLKIRPLFNNVYRHISDECVKRPGVIENYPDTDCEWANEAVASDQQEQLDHIATTETSLRNISHICPRACSIDDLLICAIQQSNPTDWLPNLDVDEQLALMRPILKHAQFIDLVIPYARGTANDDTCFAKRILADFATHATPQFPRSAVLHVSAPTKSKPGSDGFNRCVNNTADNLETCLKEVSGTSCTIAVMVWGKLLDRYLIAGTGTHPSLNQPATGSTVHASRQDDRRVRWVLSMGHTASPEDRNRQDGAPEDTAWHMKSTIHFSRIFKTYCTDLRPPKVYRIRPVL